MPFRRASDLIAGIELPQLRTRALRESLEAASRRLVERPRIVVFGCDHGVRVERLESERITGLSLPCIAALPPPFIDYVLSRGLAEGVFLTGCREGTCHHRFGIAWTEQRLAGTRDPRLRARIPRQRLAKLWAAPPDARRLARALADFEQHLRALDAEAAAPSAAACQGPDERKASHG